MGQLARKKMDYRQMPQFLYYDLAEGYLLEVREGNPMEFIVDAALTRDYPKKEPFLRWRKIAISFPNVRDVRWIRKTIYHPSIDAAGEIDFGGIYEFEIQGYRHRLSGDFGEVEIISDPVQVKDIAHETTDMAGAVPDDEEEEH